MISTTTVSGRKIPSDTILAVLQCSKWKRSPALYIPTRTRSVVELMAAHTRETDLMNGLDSVLVKNGFLAMMVESKTVWYTQENLSLIHI